MFNFLHTFRPEPILISFGVFNVYWYGFFIVFSFLTALSVSLKLAKKFDFSPNKIFDLGFWLIIWGVVGARAYHVLLEIEYYLKKPLDVFKIWQGGLAIHGALIAGVIVIYLFSKKEKISFWFISAIILPGIVLAQAIGRWGNYFNQELFGRPTDLPWGIPISLINRPARFISAEFFHPTFLYESLGNLLIFLVLLFLLFKVANKKKNYEIIFFAYVISYSVLRFFLEFIRLDQTPDVFGMRLPQIVSLIIIAVCFGFVFKKKISAKKSEI